MSLRFGYSSLTIFAVALLVAPLGHGQQPAAATTPAVAGTNAPAGAPAKVDPAQALITEAVQKMGADDVEGAMAKLGDAIKANPQNPTSYVLRASVYCQKKLWPQAEADFNTAAKLAPTNTVIQFNLVEVKLLQRQYDVARAGYLKFEKDPAMGDLATFKVFLCDLMAGHEDIAKKELDAINADGSNPSYYFANSAWCLYHKKIEDGRGWLISASRIFNPRKNGYSAQSILD